MTQESDVITCKIGNSRILIQIVSCLVETNRKDQICYFAATPECKSLTVSVIGRSKCNQARATLQGDLFDYYSCSQSNVEFAVNLNTLLTCLNLHGFLSENTTATLVYSSSEAILKLSLEEQGVLSICDIQTIDMSSNQEEHPELFMAFQDSREVSQIIMKSEPLKEAIHDLIDMSDSHYVTISVYNAPYEALKFSAEDIAAGCTIEFPRICDAFISYKYEGVHESSSWIYSIPLLELGMKALIMAGETFIRINEDGMLCVQHQLPLPENKVVFIDFLMLACDESVAT